MAIRFLGKRSWLCRVKTLKHWNDTLGLYQDRFKLISNIKKDRFYFQLCFLGFKKWLYQKLLHQPQWYPVGKPHWGLRACVFYQPQRVDKRCPTEHPEKPQAGGKKTHASWVILASHKQRALIAIRLQDAISCFFFGMVSYFSDAKRARLASASWGVPGSETAAWWNLKLLLETP